MRQYRYVLIVIVAAGAAAAVVVVAVSHCGNLTKVINLQLVLRQCGTRGN